MYFSKNATVAFIFGTVLLSAPYAQAVSTDTAINIPDNAGSSYNWSGYVASGTGYTSVSGSWQVPVAISTSSYAANAAWVGIGGTASTDLIQAGTQSIVTPGGTAYRAFYELLPDDAVYVDLDVRAGDTITASVTEVSSGTWHIIITNNTTGHFYQNTVTYASSHTSAEWIEEMPSSASGTFIPLANFSPVAFSNGLAVENGATLTIAQTGATPLALYDTSDTILATPSALASDGQSFTVTRTASDSTSSVSEPYEHIRVYIMPAGIRAGTMPDITSPRRFHYSRRGAFSPHDQFAFRPMVF